MKASSRILIVGLVIAGFAAYIWHRANTVFADEPFTSGFFRTYDPNPVFSKYGIVRQGGGSMGGRPGCPEGTQTRRITALIAMPASHVAGLSSTLRDDIDSKLRTQGHLMGSSEDSGEYSYEYNSGSAWGDLTLERIEPEQSNSGDAETWRVRMRMIERCQK
jgi:hypothetical protein